MSFADKVDHTKKIANILDFNIRKFEEITDSGKSGRASLRLMHDALHGLADGSLKKINSDLVFRLEDDIEKWQALQTSNHDLFIDKIGEINKLGLDYYVIRDAIETKDTEKFNAMTAKHSNVMDGVSLYLVAKDALSAREENQDCYTVALNVIDQLIEHNLVELGTENKSKNIHK